MQNTVGYIFIKLTSNKTDNSRTTTFTGNDYKTILYERTVALGTSMDKYGRYKLLKFYIQYWLC